MHNMKKGVLVTFLLGLIVWYFIQSFESVDATGKNISISTPVAGKTAQNATGTLKSIEMRAKRIKRSMIGTTTQDEGTKRKVFLGKDQRKKLIDHRSYEYQKRKEAFYKRYQHRFEFARERMEWRKKLRREEHEHGKGSSAYEILLAEAPSK